MHRLKSFGAIEGDDVVARDHERGQAGACRCPEEMDMPDVSPSVLVIRLDGIGDALTLVPLLAALRDRGIPADVVLSPANAGIFSSRAARRCIAGTVALRSSSAQNRERIRDFGRILARNGYTHTLVATEDPSGYRLARASGAPVRVGFSNGWGKPFKTLWSRAFLTDAVYRSAGLDSRAPHECDVLFELGRQLLGDARPSRDPAALRPLVLERELQPDERVAMQITDKWERSAISEVRVLETIAAVRNRHPLRLIAATSEAAYAERIASKAGMPVERFETLEPWKEAVASASALVAPDSGALHVAGLTGTPTVAIFPPSRDLALQAARWAPWAARHRIVVADGEWPGRVLEALAQLRRR